MGQAPLVRCNAFSRDSYPPPSGVPHLSPGPADSLERVLGRTGGSLRHVLCSVLVPGPAASLRQDLARARPPHSCDCSGPRPWPVKGSTQLGSLLGSLKVLDAVGDLGVDDDIADLDVLQQLVALNDVPEGRKPPVLHKGDATQPSELCAWCPPATRSTHRKSSLN